MTFDNGGEGAYHTMTMASIPTSVIPTLPGKKEELRISTNLFDSTFPKNANLKEMTDEKIHVIQEKLNNRPR